MIRARNTVVLIVAGLAVLCGTPPGWAQDYVFVTKFGSPRTGDGEFNLPSGVAVDPDGNVYVGDTDNNRIQKFTSAGVFLSKWGSYGSGDGQFYYPEGVAVDADGNVYVADTDNNRIQKFTSEGGFLTKWGSPGSGDGQFQWPLGVAVDSAGNVYVADEQNHRIQKFTTNGGFLAKWGSYGSGDGQFREPSGIALDVDGNVYVADSDNERIQKFTGDGVFLTKWGSEGTGDGQFDDPEGIAVDADGNVYVADTDNSRMQKFTSSGVFLTKWGSAGIGNGQFRYPEGVAADPDGNVYVADLGNARIQKFTSVGAFVTKWPSYGAADGQFYYPQDVAVDAVGNVYVADTANDRIQKFTSAGVFLTTWGSYGTGNGQFHFPHGVGVDDPGNVYVADTENNRIQKFTSEGVFVTKWGSQGGGNGQFDEPMAVAANALGNVYVADAGRDRIQKFTSAGVFLTKWGSSGSGTGQFYRPCGVAVDAAGNVYVSDTDNHRIQKFTSDGVFLTKWGSWGGGDGEFRVPRGMAVDAAGNVCVGEEDNPRIQKFASDGTFLTKWGSPGMGDGQFNEPSGLAVNADGSVYVVDTGNGRVQVFSPAVPPPSLALPVAGYYMISFPLMPSSATVHDLLCDDLGCGNYYMWGWQAGRYETAATSSPGCQSAIPGAQRGYWLLAAAATLDFGGALPQGDQTIPLQTGWTMVAAPYEATIDSLLVDNAGDVRSLAAAQAANWVAATFFYSDDGTGSYSTLTINQTPPDQLSSWHSYWVRAAFECSLIVPEPGGGGTSGRAVQEPSVSPAWAFDIHASSAGSVDTITIAAADAASDDFDGFALDMPKPPAPPGEGRLHMVLKPDAAAAGGRLDADSELAMETKDAAQDAAEWQFTVTGGVKGESVALSWPELSQLPKDRVAILVDCDTSTRTFMRARARYEFTAPGEGNSRNFAVTVKAAQNAGPLISSFSALPLRGSRGAELTFNLSADANVDISIVNVAGRLVGRLREGVSTEAGRHMVTWDGQSISDTALPNGLYLCVLKARAPDGQQASAVRRVMLVR